MKRFDSIVAAVLSVILLTGCDKKINTYLDVDRDNALKTNLKIVHASAYTVNYAAALRVNGARVSGPITNATPFPGGGLNTGGSNTPWYLSLDGGVQRIELVVPNLGSFADSLFLYQGSLMAESGKFYTAYITDTAASTKLAVFTEDPTPPTTNVTRFRFVNIMPNVPSVDLYFGNQLVAGGVGYLTSSPDFTLNQGDTAHWAIRPAGAAATSAAISTYPATAAPFSVPGRRVMSAFARGYRTATGNKAPAISFLYN